MCCWIAEMPLSDSQVKAEQAGLRRRNVSVGDSLFWSSSPLPGVAANPFKAGCAFPLAGRASRCMYGLACMANDLASGDENKCLMNMEGEI